MLSLCGPAVSAPKFLPVRGEGTSDDKRGTLDAASRGPATFLARRQAFAGNMDGPMAPKDWQGGLPIKYWLISAVAFRNANG